MTSGKSRSALLLVASIALAMIAVPADAAPAKREGAYRADIEKPIGKAGASKTRVKHVVHHPKRVVRAPMPKRPACSGGGSTTSGSSLARMRAALSASNCN